MFTFTVNGTKQTCEEDMPLLTYLREVLHLTSVKNGCSEGACGTCTVLADGKAVKSCVMKLSRMDGKSIVTLEGLTEEEQGIYGWAFARSGAVQCGFCIPGMVMAAKGLIDQNNDPTEEEIRKAIRGNICRCTGYVKIVKAIRLAADIISGRKQMDEEGRNAAVGSSFIRVDALDKATGKALYCDDMFMDGMLHGAVLRSAYPRAKVLSIDTSEAEALPGVVCVLTEKDVPGNNVDGYMVKDVPTFVPVGDFTRCVGDAIAAVAAVDIPTAEKARDLIRVEYEEHEPVVDIYEAMKEDAPKLHENGNILSHNHLKHGDVEADFAGAAHVVTETVCLGPVDHAYLEPESGMAYYDGDTMIVYSTSQSVYHDKEGICRITGIPEDRLQVQSRYVGGAFGGKEDLHVQHYAALLCQASGKPVKVTVSRAESMRFHPKRHPMDITYSLAADEEGHFISAKAVIYSDTGAYASLGGAVIGRACTHVPGPYRVRSFEVDGYAIYTNNPPYGAFRGFGVAQIVHAQEIVIDRLAEKLGLDRYDIRYMNALRPGDVMGTGQKCMGDVAFRETLEALEPVYRKALADGKIVGIGCAYKNTGMGGGMADEGRVNLEVKDGRILLYTAAQCLGQGLSTVMIQIASETLGIPGELFTAILPNTINTPDAGATTASRQTAVTGEAARLAALKMKEALEGHTLADLEGQVFCAKSSPPTQPINDPNTEFPRSQISYGFATTVVTLGDDGKVDEIWQAQDVGHAINRQNVEGQMEGGIVMGMGYTLTEKFLLDKGYVKSKYGTIGLLRATDVPPIHTIIVEKNDDPEAYGAKGIGELATIPISGAIASAYCMKNGSYETVIPLQNTPYNKAKK